jgi:hypothetical protein
MSGAPAYSYVEAARSQQLDLPLPTRWTQATCDDVLNSTRVPTTFFAISDPAPGLLDADHQPGGTVLREPVE